MINYYAIEVFHLTMGYAVTTNHTITNVSGYPMYRHTLTIHTTKV